MKKISMETEDAPLNITGAVKRKLKLTDALSKAAITFLSQEHGTFEDTMTAGVSRIAEAAKLDRISLWRNFTMPDGEHASQIYRWEKAYGSVEASTPARNDVPYAKAAPYWLEQFLQGKSVSGPADKIPGGALLQSFGVVSAFLQPVFFGGKLWGIAIFSNLWDERYFDDDLADMLRSAAFLCMNAAIREDMQRDIIEAEVLKKTRAADEFARLVFEAMPIACDLWTRDGYVLDCNAEALKLFGVSSLNEYRERFHELSPAYQSDGRLSQDAVQEIINAVMREGTLRCEWIHNDVHGTYIPMVIHAKRVIYRGEYVAAGFKYDMREERNAQLQAREAEKNIRLMFNSMPLCSWIWSEDFAILDCNQETLQLFGLREKPASIEMFYQFTPEYQPDGRKSADVGKEKITDAFEKGYVRFECVHQTLSGEPIPCEVTLVRSAYDGRQVVISYVHDLREQKKMLAAQTASYAKTTFLSNMSHEIRTPMNAIIGMTTLGKSAAATDRKDYCFQKIEEAGQHLLGIINDVLDMSKIEANKLELSLQEFQFEKMLQKAVNVIHFRVDEKRQQFSVQIDRNIPKTLIGDDQRLTQVIVNLLSNANKFTAEGGSIRLAATFLGEADGICTIQVAVKDTGIGISAEQQEKLFTAFQQAETDIARKYGGTGLGLAISKQIIELMDGEIRVESEPGRGAAFVFTVQLRRGAQSGKACGIDKFVSKQPFPASNPGAINDAAGADWQPPCIEQPDITGQLADKIILLAEDVEVNREIVLALLEDTGVTIDCAENGKEALRMFRQSPERYDMIFMDVQMPEMDGYEATQKIRACGAPNAKTIPIIAMTANVFREDVERCLAAGMNGHVGKPIDIGEVLDKLRG